ncbi:MAG: helix-hairpin-helix domain-containing protein, partial [Anaerolineae bacterium]
MKERDAYRKIAILGQEAQFDQCGVHGSQVGHADDPLLRSIYHAILPGGRTTKLLKVLFSNACVNDCYYCAQRRGRDFRRTCFQPEELARAFDQMQRQRLVEGLFLSSAVHGRAPYIMERMIAVVEIIRQKYQFQGYVHLKIIPGVSQAAVEWAIQLADRVSINLEAPNAERLARIAPGKDFDRQLLTPMHWVKAIADEREAQGLRGPSQTTQLVVGAADESDREILTTVSRLYREVGLARAYFSPFRPIKDTPLENHPPTPPIREHRLYQSDFLLRRYGFALEELIFDQTGNLPTDADPKLLWARAHPEHFPVEVNTASREELLRVPGIGPHSARRIIEQRRQGKVRSLAELRRMGAAVQRASPFILLDGRAVPRQLDF